MAKKLEGVGGIGGVGVPVDPIEVPKKDVLIKAQITKASNSLRVYRNSKWVNQYCYKSVDPYPACTIDCPAAVLIKVPEKERVAFREKYKDGMAMNVSKLTEKSLAVSMGSAKDSVAKVAGTVFIRMCTGAIIEVYDFEK